MASNLVEERAACIIPILGVGFSILIANMVAVALDHYEWSNPRYTWKNILAMCLIVVLSGALTFLVIRFGGVYHG